MQIINQQIDRYLDDLLPEREAVVQEMETLAKQRNCPSIGPQVGRICHQIARSIGARRIFELGSGFGYSTYWFATALPPGGKVFFTDFSDENIKLARDFFDRCGVVTKVEIHKGDALDTLQRTEGQFDLIFNDLDKALYPVTLDLVLPRLRKGGVLLTDNLLWHGKVLDPQPSHQTQGIMEYTRRIFSSQELFTVLIPVRDGLGVSLKVR
ncbi:MAG: O-methyltransferase [bacterium]